MTTPERAPILLVEDDDSLREVITFNLEEEGFSVQAIGRADDALGAICRRASMGEPYSLVLTDVRLPGGSGADVLRAAQERMPNTPVLLVTAYGTLPDAVAALAAGAADYITKPFRRAELKARVWRAIEQAAGRVEVSLDGAGSPENGKFITVSSRMNALLRAIDRVAPTDIPVLLLGESGTGKELIARRLHARSARGQGPFVAINCAALPAELLESELFGHEAGAFTGATRLHRGRFEQAQGGTLFFDEVGELPFLLQAKLLRVLEGGEVARLGGERLLRVNVRVVAATHRDLDGAVRQGLFRNDLYHRLAGMSVYLPPLRERPEDIQPLVEHFLAELDASESVTVAPALMAELRRRTWTGNVRELRNALQRMVVLRTGDRLDLVDLLGPTERPYGSAAPPTEAPADIEPLGERVPSTPGGGLLEPGNITLPESPFSLPDLEAEIVRKALEKHAGNQSATARYLGIPRHVLLYRLEKLDAERTKNSSNTTRRE